MWHIPVHHTAALPTSLPLESQYVELEIRQQPREALVAVDGKEKARKPVDPPPIIQLRVSAVADPQQHFLQSPYLFMCCQLQPERPVEPRADGSNPMLSGSLVSSLHRLKDQDNQEGAYFVFGDISVKVLGRHRLIFNLFDLRKDSKDAQFIKSIVSEPFDVVHQKDFRGLAESTYLSRAFSDQGVRLRLRKEPRAFSSAQKRSYYHMSAGPSNPRTKRSAGSYDNSEDQQYGDAKRYRSEGGYNTPPNNAEASRQWNAYNQRTTQYGERALGYSSSPQTALPYNHGNVAGPSNQTPNQAQWQSHIQSQVAQIRQMSSNLANAATHDPYQSDMYTQTYGHGPATLGSNNGTNAYRAPGMSHALPSHIGEAHEAAATLSSIHQPQAQDTYGLANTLSPTQQQPMTTQHSMYRPTASLSTIPALSSSLIQGSQPAPYRPISRYEESLQAARHNLQTQASPTHMTQSPGHDLSRTSMPRNGQNVYDTSMPQNNPGHEKYSG